MSHNELKHAISKERKIIETMRGNLQIARERHGPGMFYEILDSIKIREQRLQKLEEQLKASK